MPTSRGGKASTPDAALWLSKATPFSYTTLKALALPESSFDFLLVLIWSELSDIRILSTPSNFQAKWVSKELLVAHPTSHPMVQKPDAGSSKPANVAV